MIKAILFDVDGVIVNAEMFSKQYEKDYHIDPAEITPFFVGQFQNCIVGKADLKEAIKPFLKGWGWQKGVDEFLTYWFQAEHKIDQPLIDYIQQLRKQGLPCYSATNQEQYRTSYMLEEMGFKNAFNGIFSSAYIGHKKPSAEFYHHIVKKLEVNPSEIMFFDNDQKNLDGANEVGIQAYLYTGLEDVKKTIESMVQ